MSLPQYMSSIGAVPQFNSSNVDKSGTPYFSFSSFSDKSLPFTDTLGLKNTSSIYSTPILLYANNKRTADSITTTNSGKHIFNQSSFIQYLQDSFVDTYRKNPPPSPELSSKNQSLFSTPGNFKWL